MLRNARAPETANTDDTHGIRAHHRNIASRTARTHHGLPSGRAHSEAKLLTRLVERLMTTLGKGVAKRNVRHVRVFFLRFPKWNALHTTLMGFSLGSAHIQF